jgi:hypothetical protein
MCLERPPRQPSTYKKNTRGNSTAMGAFFYEKVQFIPWLQTWDELDAKKIAQLNHFSYICSVK